MLPDRVSNPGPLTYESGALPIALHHNMACPCRLKPTLKLSHDYPKVLKYWDTYSHQFSICLK